MIRNSIAMVLALAVGGAAAAEEPGQAGDLAALQICMEGDHPFGIYDSCANLVLFRCMDEKGGQTAETEAACLPREIAAWDEVIKSELATLTAAAAEIETAYPPPPAQLLAEAQTAWDTGRTLQCLVHADLAKAAGQDPTAAQGLCLQKLTAERAILLFEFRFHSLGQR